ncbi:MAG: hypothetical protein ACC656_14340, partial [Candidatus Heimdallarchaeota archaeon]
RSFMLVLLIIIFNPLIYGVNASLASSKSKQNNNLETKLYQVDNKNTRILEVSYSRVDYDNNGVYDSLDFNVLVYSNTSTDLSIGYSLYGYQSSDDIRTLVDSGIYFYNNSKIGENLFIVGITSGEILYYMKCDSYFEMDVYLFEGQDDNPEIIIDSRNEIFTDIYDIEGWESFFYSQYIKTIEIEFYDGDTNGIYEGISVSVFVKFNKSISHFLNLDLNYVYKNKEISVLKDTQVIGTNDGKKIIGIFYISAENFIQNVSDAIFFNGWITLNSESNEGVYDKVRFWSDYFKNSWEIGPIKSFEVVNSDILTGCKPIGITSISDILSSRSSSDTIPTSSSDTSSTSIKKDVPTITTPSFT